MTTVLSYYTAGGEIPPLGAVVAMASLLYFRVCSKKKSKNYLRRNLTVRQCYSGAGLFVALMFITSFTPIILSYTQFNLVWFCASWPQELWLYFVDTTELRCAVARCAVPHRNE